MRTSATNRHASAAPVWAAAAAGLLSVVAGVSVGSAVAAVLRGIPSPIVSVGNLAVDHAPPALKDFAVRQFGTADKAVLLGGVAVSVALLAIAAGVIGRTRPRVGLGLVWVVGLIGVGTAAVDHTSTAPRPLLLLPSVLTVLVSVASLRHLLRSLALRPHPTDDLPPTFDRRTFLKGVLAVGTVAAAGAVVGRTLKNTAAAVSRAAIRIARPARPAPPIPAGTELDVPGITPYVTPNASFYRVDTALQVPDVPAEGWSLRIHGMVEREVRLSYRDLMAMPLVERRITLTCVSNEVGGPYAGNAAWIGVPVKDLLERVGVREGADAVKSTSADGWTCGTPLHALTDGRDALVALAMNGVPLPLEHGFPARLVVPGLFGYVSATKWLTDLDVTRFADFKAYWSTRDYAVEAPIKMASRIDVPRAFQKFPAGSITCGGVAWAQQVGIGRVEVQVDDDPWQQADLGAQDSVDTWRQWSWTWPQPTPGRHTLTVRATDLNGTTQTSDRAPIRPDGATGWHSVQFSVE